MTGMCSSHCWVTGMWHLQSIFSQVSSTIFVWICVWLGLWTFTGESFVWAKARHNPNVELYWWAIFSGCFSEVAFVLFDFSSKRRRIRYLVARLQIWTWKNSSDRCIWRLMSRQLWNRVTNQEAFGVRLEPKVGTPGPSGISSMGAYTNDFFLMARLVFDWNLSNLDSVKAYLDLASLVMSS